MKISEMDLGEICLLENIRFNAEEEKNGNGRFWYAKWTDIIVNSLGLIIGYHLHKHLK